LVSAAIVANLLHRIVPILKLPCTSSLQSKSAALGDRPSCLIPLVIDGLLDVAIAVAVDATE
jgi:hypothetical protein